MLNDYEIHDTRDLAEALLDADTDEGDRRAISELFEAFGIEADRPDDIDVSIIPERMFPEYVREMAEDCGYVDNVPDWVEIDWEATSRNVSIDYVMVGVEIDGNYPGRETYFLFRAA